ncbi:GNAT family N-acetyltransferase [Streptomyces sp. NPDC088921]|uniref:GNAT family N-acetyltransferase n=1 Tax=unclassified Streptomyces TaxID=2593676 RepID=UPI003441044B
MNATRMGDAVVLSMRDDPTRFWSKALGFGRSTPVTSDLVSEVCSFYRAERTPMAVLQIAPSLIPDDWSDVCAREGISGGSSWVKLVAETSQVVSAADDPERRQADGVRVGPVESHDSRQWASVMLRAFGMPEPHYVDMVESSVGKPDWHPHAVWMGTEIVGTGTMYTNGETAQLFGGAVLPHARNRGGQTELLIAGARAARQSGCLLLVAETGVEVDGDHNPSLHNMLGLGFKVAYERRNWVWKPNE